MGRPAAPSDAAPSRCGAVRRGASGHRQALPALGPSSLEDQPPVLGGHPAEEPVGAPAPPAIRLERTFHGNPLSPLRRRDGRTFNSTERWRLSQQTRVPSAVTRVPFRGNPGVARDVKASYCGGATRVVDSRLSQASPRAPPVAPLDFDEGLPSRSRLRLVGCRDQAWFSTTVEKFVENRVVARRSCSPAPETNGLNPWRKSQTACFCWVFKRSSTSNCCHAVVTNGESVGFPDTLRRFRPQPEGV